MFSIALLIVFLLLSSWSTFTLFTLLQKRTYSPFGIFCIVQLIVLFIFIGIPFFLGSNDTMMFLGLYLAQLFNYVYELIRTQGKNLQEKALNFRNKLASQNNEIDKLEDLIGKKLLYLIIILIVVSYLSYEIGYGIAARKKEYAILSIQGRNFAVVRIYGNRALAMPIDLETSILDPDVFIFNIENTSQRRVGLSMKKTGVVTIK